MRTDSRSQTVARPGQAQSRPLLPAVVRPAATAVLVLSVALTIVMIACFWHGTTPSWPDTVVDRSVHRILGWHPWPPTRDIADLGEPLPVIALTAVLTAGCLVLRRFRAGILVAVSVPVAAAVTELLKPLVDRKFAGAAGYHLGASFPSGHATGVFALAAVLSVLLLSPEPVRMPWAVRVLIALAAFLVAAAVAVAVIALYSHYFTDTVAGAAISVAVVLGLVRILDLPRWRTAAGLSPGGAPGQSGGHDDLPDRRRGAERSRGGQKAIRPGAEDDR